VGSESAFWVVSESENIVWDVEGIPNVVEVVDERNAGVQEISNELYCRVLQVLAANVFQLVWLLSSLVSLPCVCVSPPSPTAFPNPALTWVLLMLTLMQLLFHPPSLGPVRSPCYAPIRFHHNQKHLTNSQGNRQSLLFRLFYLANFSCAFILCAVLIPIIPMDVFIFLPSASRCVDTVP